MGSIARYRQGDIHDVEFPADPVNHPIEEGDLVFVHPSTNKVWPAADMANQGSASLNQDAFQQYFAGVALKKCGAKAGEKTFRLDVSEDNVCRVATAGRFEFDCAATAWKPGDLVGVAADTNGCSNQKVTTAASASLSIGRAAPHAAALGQTMTRVVVDIQSTVMAGGVQNQVSGSGSGQ